MFMDRPAERPGELFDREGELGALLRALRDRAAVLVVGMRRVGKTSLLRAATHGMSRAYVDARALEERRHVSYADLLEALRGALREVLPLHRRLGELLATVRGVQVAGVEVRFQQGRGAPRLVDLLEALDRWGEERGERAVLVLDEAQELVKLRGRDILPALAYAYDNLRHLTIVYSGSKAGLLHRFLRLDDPESPLFGRYMERIDVAPFPRELAVRYLEEGFAAAGTRPDRRLIEDAVEALDGVVGWLAHFGLRALSRPDTALEETLHHAERLAASEFCHFVEAMGTHRYIHVARLMATGARWSDVKRYLTALEGRPITDGEVTKLVRNLVDYGFAEKKGDVYTLADPALRRVLPRIKCRHQEP